MLKIKDLVKNYGDKIVLDGINISFKSGKVYGIVGENGSGKTTFFRCIAQLEKFQGNIESNYHPLRHYLGYIMAENYFMSKITGEEYIRLILEAGGKKNIDINTKNIFNLPLDRYVENYSTGMKKKLAITATLLQDNEIIIMDEPFNGLDFQTCIILAELIHILRSKGKTIILSSHIFSSLIESCDFILKLTNGKLSDPILKDGYKELELELKSKLIPNNLSDFL